MINNPNFTGERVVPNKTTDPQTMAEHLIRYSFASRYARVERLLDAACGTGYGMKIMRMLGAYGVGMDVDQEAIACAAELNGNAKFYQVDFEKEDIAGHCIGQSFDLITSFETIEHLEDPNLFLQGIIKLIKDDGRFIYSIPLANPSKFHKVVYTIDSALELINKYFVHEKIYIQEGLELVNFERMNGNINGLNRRGIFVVGICRKK